jgi:hypothetical protein
MARSSTSKGVPPEKRARGRPKGSPNKVQAAAKAILEEVVERLDGADGLYAWAQQNESAFWLHLFPKLLPLDVRGTHNINHTITKPAAFEQMTRAQRDDYYNRLREQPASNVPLLITLDNESDEPVSEDASADYRTIL